MTHPNRIRGVAFAVCYEARLLTISNSENQFLPVAEIVDYEINDIAPIIKRHVGLNLYTQFLWHAFNIQHHTDGQPHLSIDLTAQPGSSSDNPH